MAHDTFFGELLHRLYGTLHATTALPAVHVASSVDTVNQDRTERECAVYNRAAVGAKCDKVADAWNVFVNAQVQESASEFDDRWADGIVLDAVGVKEAAAPKLAMRAIAKPAFSRPPIEHGPDHSR